MRALVERFARRWWAGELGASGRLLAAVSTPLSWMWSGASALVGARRASRAVRIRGLTVVSVGNLAVGGTGKTPLVSWIAARLLEEEARPAVLVGGHAPDEAALHERRLGALPVISGRDRVAAARSTLAAGRAVAILDDGFQHRAIARDLDVVLLAAEDAFPGPVLPRGPYREPPRALERAHAVVVTRRASGLEESRALEARVEAMAPGLVVGGVELAPGAWTTLEGRPAAGPAGDVLATCAVARPAAFRSSVESRVSGSVELVAFADHHVYTPADVEKLKRRAAGRPLVTTEKDAVKLNAHAEALDDAYVLTEEVRWDWGEEAFLSRLRAVVAASPVR